MNEDALKALRAIAAANQRGPSGAQQTTVGQSAGMGIESTLQALREAAATRSSSSAGGGGDGSGGGGAGGGGGGMGGGASDPLPQLPETARSLDNFKNALNQAAAEIPVLGAGAATVVAQLNSIKQDIVTGSDTVIQNNRVLENYNPQIAAANVQSQFRQMRRGYQYGAEVAQGYGRVMEARDDYRDMMAEMMGPSQNLMMNLQANLQQGVNTTLSGIKQFVDPINDAIRAFNLKFFGPPPANLSPIDALLSDASDGKINGVGTGYLNPTGADLMSDADRKRFQDMFANNPMKPRLP